MTPAPKDAPVELDLLRDAMDQLRWFLAVYGETADDFPLTRAVMDRYAAFAAGRQAAPQPEGGQTADWLDRIAEVTAPAEIARLRSRIAALEAALRKYGDHQDEGCFAEPEKRCMCGLDEAMGRTALTTAKTGKGEK